MEEANMASAGKIDLFKDNKAEYASPKKPTLVETGPASYLTFAGKGDPAGDAFQDAIMAMYAMAYTIKMTSKFAGRDYTVCKLECLWWAGRKGCEFETTPKDKWNWKLLIRVPDFINEKHLNDAVNSLREKGKAGKAGNVKLEQLDEGNCVQMLHVGPYEKVGETVTRMMDFSGTNGLVPNGRHHEIYLSDPRRVEPARLKTIVRQPVKKNR
jgi:hypothetical protein